MPSQTPMSARIALCVGEVLPGLEHRVGVLEADGRDLVAGGFVAGAEPLRRLPHRLGVAVILGVVGVAPTVQAEVAVRQRLALAPDVLAPVDHVAAGGRRQRLGQRQHRRILAHAIRDDRMIQVQLFEADAVLIVRLGEVDGHSEGAFFCFWLYDQNTCTCRRRQSPEAHMVKAGPGSCKDAAFIYATLAGREPPPEPRSGGSAPRPFQHSRDLTESEGSAAGPPMWTRR